MWLRRYFPNPSPIEIDKPCSSSVHDFDIYFICFVSSLGVLNVLVIDLVIIELGRPCWMTAGIQMSVFDGRIL